MTSRISTLFQVGCTIRDDMLTRFSCKADGACRRLRNSPFAEILHGCKGAVQIFDRTVNPFVRHLGPALCYIDHTEHCNPR